MGVSKRQPVERVAAALRCRAPTTWERTMCRRPATSGPASRPCSAAAPGPRWHMIGGLQRNKARAAIELFDCIETVDRPALARELDKRAAAAGRSVDILLQVKLGREEQKSGVLEEALPALLEACGALEHLRVVGLMTIPSRQRLTRSRAVPPFGQLRALRDRAAREPGRRVPARALHGDVAGFRDRHRGGRHADTDRNRAVRASREEPA